MASIAQLPNEVLIEICSQVDNPNDLLRLANTCRPLNRLIKGNAFLYKQFFLTRWGDPTDNPVNNRRVDWEKEANDIARMTHMIQSRDEAVLAKEAPFITQTVASLLRVPDEKKDGRAKQYVQSIFPKDDAGLWPLICHSSLYSRARSLIPATKTKDDADKSQASAHLHCLYGVPQIELTDDINAQPFALARVYDMRAYVEEKNGWGPFLDDGSWFVDWEKLEAIMIVLGANIRRLSTSDDSWISKLWAESFQGTYPYSYRPMRPRCPHAQPSHARTDDKEDDKKPKRTLDQQDPYGITGTYLRIVCFLDYRVLFNYNWGHMRPHRIDEQMPPIHEEEATRMIAMSIAVDKIEWPEDESTQADVPDGTTATTAGSADTESELLQATKDALDATSAPHAYATRSAEKKKKAKRDKPSRMPVVHFSGTSRALHAPWDPNANSRIKGTVRTTPEGEVRWTTVSIFHNHEERWKSEGIQIGGVQSGRGVIGTWFDANYDVHGPAGPTAFWKIRDEGESCRNEIDGEEVDVSDLDIEAGDGDSAASASDDDEGEEVVDASDSDEEHVHHLLLDENIELILVQGDPEED